MGAVNVSGRGAAKRKRNRILPSHAKRAYERFKGQVQTHTEEQEESAYGSADEALTQIRQDVEGTITPVIRTLHPRRKKQPPVPSSPGSSGVNVAAGTRSTGTAPTSGPSAVTRRGASRWFAAKQTTRKKPRTKGFRQFLRRTVRTVSNSVRAILSAAKSMILAIAAGGWVSVVIVAILCIVGLLVSSPFGVFFSGEDTGTGQTMRDAVRQIDQAYSDRIDQLRSSIARDDLEMSGSRAVWPEVLTIYAVKTTTDPDAPMETVSMTEEKCRILSEIFWAMNEISAVARQVTRTEIIERADEDGNIIEEEIEVTKTILYITVGHKTAEEVAQELAFSESQLLQVDELLSEEYRTLWSAVLYGIHSTDEQIVSVALSQIGNVGGEPYWSWYGFESRVEWCACFVSWCANECGYIDAGIIPKFASCRNGMLWFQTRGQWLPGTAEPTPGMIIFFDWNDENGQDGLPDHVGIVRTVENNIIYTIEGNSGDACKERNYPLDNYQILGFGVPAY